MAEMNIRMFPKLEPEDFAVLRALQFRTCDCCGGEGVHALYVGIGWLEVFVGFRQCHNCISGMMLVVNEN